MRSITVALTTFQESVRQPAFYALLILGTMLLVFAFAMPTFTLTGGEVKFIRDIGLGTFTLCILLLGIFSSANLITTEIENKTAMTVMSKPLRRWEFVFGKYLGIIMSVAFLGALLTAVFVVTIVAKVTGGDIVVKTFSYAGGVWPEVSIIFPGLILGLFEAFVLIAISVGLSIRLPMILNVSISFGLFILANLSGPVIDWMKSQVPAGKEGVALPVAKFFYYVLPNFQSGTETFSAIGLGRVVPMPLVGWTVLYSLIYILAAISIAVFLFHDKELG
jgi:ABC-type transport system involved in multi-copper enzyme maturation permease subunit